MAIHKVKIAGITYQSKAAAERHASKLLHAASTSDPIVDPDDVAFLSDLVHSRPQKVAEIGGRIIKSWGRLDPSIPDNPPCFAVFFEDGSHMHFSIRRSISALAKAQNQAAQS